MKKIAICCLTGVVIATAIVPGQVHAASAGVTATVTQNVTAGDSSTTVFSGISGAFSEFLLDVSANTKTVTAESVVEQTTKEIVTKSKYADMAVANVNDYVNIRRKPTTQSAVTGKLYKNGVVTILQKKNGWYQITSGNAKGWVKADYLTVDEEAVKSVGTKVATVTTQTLRVREKASTDAAIIGLVPEEEELTVLKSKTGWVKVSIEEGNGWVSTDYVTTDLVFTYAESRKEEKARLAKEQAEKEAAAKAAAASASSVSSSKNTSSSSNSSSTSSSSSSSSSSSTSSSSSSTSSSSASSSGQAVASYACQFIGNPYVYGGTSLTNGADCSGFVMSVYARFGITSLPHSSTALRSVGYAVSTSSMQPGDIICYSGHVAIYIGNNTIVHASNQRDGIKITSPANYRTILAVRRIF